MTIVPRGTFNKKSTSQFICEDEFSYGGHASRMLLTSLRSRDEVKS